MRLSSLPHVFATCDFDVARRGENQRSRCSLSLSLSVALLRPLSFFERRKKRIKNGMLEAFSLVHHSARSTWGNFSKLKLFCASAAAAALLPLLRASDLLSRASEPRCELSNAAERKRFRCALLRLRILAFVFAFPELALKR